jgi:hypothetical protein
VIAKDFLAARRDCVAAKFVRQREFAVPPAGKIKKSASTRLRKPSFGFIVFKNPKTSAAFLFFDAIESPGKAAFYDG